jgi:hypothetical protein
VGTIAISSVCLGAALGLRFRVFALFPVIILEMLVVTTFGLAQNHSVGTIVLANIIGAFCLQLGYIVGTLPRYLLAAARLNREGQLNRESQRVAAR